MMWTDRRRELAATLALAFTGSVGAFFLSLQPILMGAWVDRAGLTLQEAGLAISAHMLGKLLGTVLALLLVKPGRARKIIVAGAALAALGELSCALAGGIALNVAAARLLAGFGGGILAASATASAAALANPDRAFALVLFCQTLTGSLGLYFAPLLLQAVGLAGLFVGLGLLSLSVVTAAPFFLEPQPRSEAAGGSSALLAPAAGLLLLSLFIHYVANNGVWAHLERIGVEAGIDAGRIGAALAVGQAFGLVGSASAMLLAQRVPRLAAILVGVVLTGGSAVWLAFVDGEVWLGVGVALFIGSLSFAVPFYLGALAAQDRAGRLVVVGQLAIMAGLFVGPSLAAFAVSSASMDVMLAASAAGFVISLVLAVAGLRRSAALP